MTDRRSGAPVAPVESTFAVIPAKAGIEGGHRSLASGPLLSRGLRKEVFDLVGPGIGRIAARVIGLGVALALLLGGTARAATPLTVVVFSAPSLGAFLPDVIKQKKFDTANGLDISFPQRTPDAYAAQFNSGEFEIGGSAAVLTIGLADTRGVKVSYLFNLFDYWGAVVTQRPEIRTLADLKGKQLAAARGTTNYSMFEWFAQRAGVDTAALAVVNTATPGLLGYALADRADAVQLWEPAYSLLLVKRPSIRTLDLGIAQRWQAMGVGPHIPYLGVGAHNEWIAQHPDQAVALYKTYQAAARFVTANPAEAAGIIAGPKADDEERRSIQQLVTDNTRLGLYVAPAAKLKDAIEAVYKAGVAIKLLDTLPSPASIAAKDLD